MLSGRILLQPKHYVTDERTLSITSGYVISFCFLPLSYQSLSIFSQHPCKTRMFSIFKWYQTLKTKICKKLASLLERQTCCYLSVTRHTNLCNLVTSVEHIEISLCNDSAHFAASSLFRYQSKSMQGKTFLYRNLFLLFRPTDDLHFAARQKVQFPSICLERNIPLMKWRRDADNL